MPLITDYYIMTSRSFNNSKESIIMISISEEEEQKLDKGCLYVKKGNKAFYILPKNIICYGEIDFSDFSEDLNTISNMKWLDHLTLRGVTIPANYDYNEHCAYSNTKFVKYYDSTNPAVVSKYVHGCLGKPKRCCIFREIK